MVRLHAETDTKPTRTPENSFFQDTSRYGNEREEIARGVAVQLKFPISRNKSRNIAQKASRTGDDPCPAFCLFTLRFESIPDSLTGAAYTF